MKTSHVLLVVLVVIVLIAAAIAYGDEPREQRDYILRRQSAYQVEGVPTKRLIIGRRQIDIYRDGSTYERDNLVGVSHEQARH
jgi:hypothetical protein